MDVSFFLRYDKQNERMRAMLDIEKIIETQRTYFAKQHPISINTRLNYLRQLKKTIKEYEALLLEGLALDLGKSSMESYITEVGLLYQHLSEMIWKLPTWAKDETVRTPLYLQPAKSYRRAVAYGNVLIIAPFNYPVLLAFDPLIGAIAGGNTALVGLSPSTPNVNKVIEQIIETVFPSAYVDTYISTKETNENVLSYRFDKLFFTGSTKVGKIVMQAAAQYLTPVTLELGGKSPAIVTETASITTAAKRVAWGKWVNNGQTCVAPDYCLVHRSVVDAFITALVAAIEKMYGAEPKNSEDYGRIVDEKSWDRLRQLLNQDDSFVIYGGDVTHRNRYISPTLLLANTKDSLASMHEEIFGPILPIVVYDELAEAVSYVQQYERPLAFYPFTRDVKTLKVLMDKIIFGDATVNDTLLHMANSHLPFGGVGFSGMGSYHGKATFDTFTHSSSILKRTNIFDHSLMRAPYSRSKERIIRWFLK